jgi:hypothetical protein
VGIERLGEATDYDKTVDFRIARSGFHCAGPFCSNEYRRLCLTSGISGERSESAACRG